MKIAVLLALVALIGCANPNRRNPVQYDWCDFIAELELYKLGFRDCADDSG